MDKIKRSEVLKIVASISELNKATVTIPWKINYAIQRSLAKLEPEHKAISKTIEAVNKDLEARRMAIQKEYADKTKDKDGKEIPLIEKGRYITTGKESELAVRLEELSKEVIKEQEKIELFLDEKIDVELFQFDVSEEDQKKLEGVSGGMLIGILPLIK